MEKKSKESFLLEDSEKDQQRLSDAYSDLKVAYLVIKNKNKYLKSKLSEYEQTFIDPKSIEGHTNLQVKHYKLISKYVALKKKLELLQNSNKNNPNTHESGRL